MVKAQQWNLKMKWHRQTKNWSDRYENYMTLSWIYMVKQKWNINIHEKCKWVICLRLSLCTWITLKTIYIELMKTGGHKEHKNVSLWGEGQETDHRDTGKRIFWLKQDNISDPCHKYNRFSIINFKPLPMCTMFIIFHQYTLSFLIFIWTYLNYTTQ